jgi:hypothetical protein
MTRRVRFTPLLCAGLFAVAILADGRARASDLPLVPQPSLAEGVQVSAASVVDETPNVFRVSLLGLGPWASTADDRTYDIALAPACPADVASSLMGATPVTLIRFDVE